MSSPIEKNPPFKPQLSFENIGTDEFNLNAGRIHELGPDFVVRRFPIEGASASSQEAKAIRAERITQERVADVFFQELQNYGVNVVPHRRIVGHDSEDGSQETIYTITDRIEGKSLDKLTPEEIREYAPQIDRTFAGIFTYIKKILAEGGVFHSELYATQFMAGTNVRRPGEGADVFCVDIDPLCFTYDPTSNNGEIPDVLAHAALAPIGDIEIITHEAQISLPRAYIAAIEMIHALRDKGDDYIKESLEEMKKHGSAIVAKGLESIT